MPRQRRRHHSRSRSRSRSHSCDRDREPKRRKIESIESPQHKRSLSPQPEEQTHNSSGNENNEKLNTETLDISNVQETTDQKKSRDHSNKHEKSDESLNTSAVLNERNSAEEESEELTMKMTDITSNDESGNESKISLHEESEESTTEFQTKTDSDTSHESDINLTINNSSSSTNKVINTSVTSKVSESKLTPRKTSGPKQVQQKLQLEKRREQKQKEYEKRKQELLEMKLKIKQEREKLKQEKQELKQKEIEEKQKEKELKEEKKKKEREEKEQKRKEKEEKIEQKRKEKEEKSEQKRKEQEEKNKEKQKLQEKKQKAAAAFANFFTKKTDNLIEEKKTEDDASGLTFMPFEVKSDMRLAPISRTKLTDDIRNCMDEALLNQNGKLYLDELKEGRKTGKSGKTWPAEEREESDIIIVEDMNLWQSIEEQPKMNNKVRAKFLGFEDNRRPPYFGTWRKKSKCVKPRKPLALDKDHFDYEYDSDEDWEEGEDTGESLHGSDDEDKDNESENEYEVDNDFFVPHGHLSDDEVNDEEGDIISPEAHKAKLKLLKKEFEEQMQGKTHKIKPRVIGCIWYKKQQNNVDDAIHEFLKPLSTISNGPIIMRKRTKFIFHAPLRNSLHCKKLSVDLIPDFLKIIHGNTNNSNKAITEFLAHLKSRDANIEVSKRSLKNQWRQFADWIKCPEEGPMLNKYCWYVRSNVKEEYNVDLTLPNK